MSSRSSCRLYEAQCEAQYMHYSGDLLMGIITLMQSKIVIVKGVEPPRCVAVSGYISGSIMLSCSFHALFPLVV